MLFFLVFYQPLLSQASRKKPYNLLITVDAEAARREIDHDNDDDVVVASGELYVDDGVAVDVGDSYTLTTYSMVNSGGNMFTFVASPVSAGYTEHDGASMVLGDIDVLGLPCDVQSISALTEGKLTSTTIYSTTLIYSNHLSTYTQYAHIRKYPFVASNTRHLLSLSSNSSLNCL